MSNILSAAGASIGSLFGRTGKDAILNKLGGYNSAAEFSPWLVLVDLDKSFPCAPEARAAWLPATSSMMCFRIAVREIEAWLLADRARVAEFLGVSADAIPNDPESLDDPKATFIGLARNSRKRDIRVGLVPREGSGATIGPTYASDVSEFGALRWRPEVAAENAPSLRRCIDRLSELIAKL